MRTTRHKTMPDGYFEEIAYEFESIANGAGKNPYLTFAFADRLRELSKQMREDSRSVRDLHQLADELRFGICAAGD